MTSTLHVIGAGLAGLACAVSATQAGRKVVVYESAKQAGGRCRSFFDAQLNTTIDNGSHAILGANPAVFKYLASIGAEAELVPVEHTGEIPFVDLENNARWTLRPNAGLFPKWIFDRARRAPSTIAIDYVKGLSLITAGKRHTVASTLSQSGTAWRTFWEPLTTAVMNTPANSASALLLGKALRQTLTTRHGGLRSYVPKTSLQQTFIDPALKFLEAAGVRIHFDSPVSISTDNARVIELHIRSGKVGVSNGESVVLAVTPWAPVTKPFLGEAFKPEPSGIVNVHYRVDTADNAPMMIGIIGGTTHWLFCRHGLVSATVSADQELVRLAHDVIAEKLWPDVRVALDLSGRATPPYRVIVERRATPLQDPSFAINRPGPKTKAANLFLAGDWVDTGLPCTLESAVRSGVKAAGL
ncbi:MAG: hydroxysqualene dehydroxylase HpnE [Rhodospirillaceae bacterium]|nr:hydroxysqualene dehydroxylase HpnE [Rhodospirillaceae bacterium]